MKAKKSLQILCIFLTFSSGTLCADPCGCPPCDAPYGVIPPPPCEPIPIPPCAPACGLQCGISYYAIGAGIIAIAVAAVLIAISSNGSQHSK